MSECTSVNVLVFLFLFYLFFILVFRAKNSKMKKINKKIVCQVLTDDVGKGTGPFVMALLIGQNVSSYCRMCSLTIECVLLL